MAETGVLPFVRGVDFSRNDFQVKIGFKYCYVCMPNVENKAMSTNTLLIARERVAYVERINVNNGGTR